MLNKDKQDTQNLMIGTKHGITLVEPIQLHQKKGSC